MAQRESYRRVSPETEESTGYRFCTAAIAGVGDGPGVAVLLTGSRPYDAELVGAELSARGYPVDRVEPGEGDVPWFVRLRREHSEPDRIYARPGRWHEWRNVRAGGLFFNHLSRAWEAGTDDRTGDGDRWLMATGEQTERIARLLPVPLPDPQRQARLAARHAVRRARAANRPRSWYDQRAERFEGAAQRLRRQAEDLIGAEPTRDPARVRFGTDPETVAALPALSVRPDETFPLLRFLHGEFRADRAWFVANRLTVGPTGGPVTVTLTVWTTKRPLEYLAVTPFNPAEGYPVDDADTDPVRRAAKLDGEQRVWGGFGWVPDIFPTSPRRLWVICDVADASALPTARELWLELTFPGGQSWLSAPGLYCHGGEHDLIYQEFVPADRPELAEVPGLAPPWVSVNVPPYPELLKTVTARLRHLPDRPTPHRPDYFED